jgi:hypothetical protein
MGDRRNWRDNLAALLQSVNQVRNLKTRVVLGAAVVSVVSLGGLPSTAQAKTPDLGSLSVPAPKQDGKLGSMFVLTKAGGASGKAFADHGSHSSHSSHRSHRSGAWVR